MGELFERSKRTDFSGIESWDASQVTDVSSMFSWTTRFNQPLNSWDVHNVDDMESMFCCAESFSQMLDSWNLSVEKLKKYFEKHDDFQNKG